MTNLLSWLGGRLIPGCPCLLPRRWGDYPLGDTSPDSGEIETHPDPSSPLNTEWTSSDWPSRLHTTPPRMKPGLHVTFLHRFSLRLEISWINSHGAVQFTHDVKLLQKIKGAADKNGTCKRRIRMIVLFLKWRPWWFNFIFETVLMVLFYFWSSASDKNVTKILWSTCICAVRIFCSALSGSGRCCVQCIDVMIEHYGWERRQH